MFILAPLYLALALTAQASAGARDAAVPGDDRLKFMQDSLVPYELTTSGDRGRVLKLLEKPVFRLGKQAAETVQDGAIFLWTGENDRPEAAVQVFQIKNSGAPQGIWIHEFSSLSPVTLTANRRGRAWWVPTKPGLAFKPLPNAPRPAEALAQRTRQMRSLAEGFRASDDFGHRGWSELRLLPRPISRYGAPGSNLIDGALFAFVLGTDPEVFLFLEARPGKEGPEWQYALAPMTIYPLKGSYQGKAVWELPDRDPAVDPSKPFFAKAYEP